MLTRFRRQLSVFPCHRGLRRIGLTGCALILLIVTAWSSPQPAWAEGIDIHGSVLETLDTSSYTYVRVKTGDSEELWVAAPRTSVRVGDLVILPQAVAMPNFYSPSFDRVFDVLYMSPVLRVSGSNAEPSAEASAAHGRTAARSPSQEPLLANVEKPQGGYTIAELWKNRDSLAGERIALRGVVVKRNDGVMGRNWVHLRDGSTDTDDHDELTITTDAHVEVGDTILLQGTLLLDQDFGYGYRYEMLVEVDDLAVE